MRSIRIDAGGVVLTATLNDSATAGHSVVTQARARARA